MDNKSLNLDKVPEGETLEVIKSFAGAGKLCSNGATMYGVQHDGVIANLFIHDGTDTTDVVARMDRVAKGSAVRLFHNADGSYGISTSGKNGSDPKVPPPPGERKWPPPPETNQPVISTNDSIMSQTAAKCVTELVAAGVVSIADFRRVHTDILSTIKNDPPF